MQPPHRQLPEPEGTSAAPAPARPTREPAPAPERTYGYGYPAEYGYGYGYPEGAEGPTLLDYWHILQRRRGTVALITICGIILAALITFPQTPIYQAVARIEIQPLNPEFMNLRQVTPVQEGGPSFNDFDIRTQVKVLESETLRERVVDRLLKQGWGKPDNELEATGRLGSWRRALNLEPSPPRPDPRKRLLAVLKDNLKIKAVPNTRIVELTVDSPDPKFAAAAANALVEEFIDENLAARWQMTQRTGEWLQRQLEEMKIKLEQSEERLQRYARESGLLYTGEQTNVAEEKLRQLQEALSKAQADRVAKQSRYELVRSSLPEALPDVLDDATLRQYQAKLTDLRREEARLATTYTDDYPELRRVRAQIHTIQQALERERATILERIRNEYEEAVRRERLLELAYRDQQKLVQEQAERAVQYNILKREVDSNRQLYEMMLSRMKEASVASALQASNVRVVDPARIPERPYKPRWLLHLALGLMFGGMVGVGWVILRERADRSLQEPGDVAFWVNLPELGVIPQAERKSLPSKSSLAKALLPGARNKGEEAEEPSLALARREDVDPVELITWKRGPSAVAEAFRSVLTSILFSSEDGKRPRVLVLTSVSPGEGKTTVATNLAIALAEINHRTLLIDADLRKPRIHELFELDVQRGLADVLNQRGELREGDLEGLVYESPVENLYVLPAGQATHASSSLLYSDRMVALLERMEREFDMLIIDTPPVGSLPDARILGRMADGVVFVVKAGQTTRDALLAARQRLASDGTRVLGAVLNFWDPKRPGSTYYGGYHRYGYYGYYRYVD